MTFTRSRTELSTKVTVSAFATVMQHSNTTSLYILSYYFVQRNNNNKNHDQPNSDKAQLFLQSIYTNNKNLTKSSYINNRLRNKQITHNKLQQPSCYNNSKKKLQRSQC
eukprot:m.29994 g.29994  ORF g.29994 m.29994 type:complete len:109 (-) comp8159_c0_seq2:105-431(-)